MSSGVTLINEPGVTVKFDSGKVLQIQGELVAQGASVSPITFTSSASSPAASDWVRLSFLSSATGASLDGSDNYVFGSILEHLCSWFKRTICNGCCRVFQKLSMLT